LRRGRELPNQVLLLTGEWLRKRVLKGASTEKTDITVTLSLTQTGFIRLDRPGIARYDVVVLYDQLQKISDTQKTNSCPLFKRGIGSGRHPSRDCFVSGLAEFEA